MIFQKNSVKMAKFLQNSEVLLLECPVIIPPDSCKKHVLAAYEKCQNIFPNRGIEILFVNKKFMVNPTIVFGQMFYRSKHNKRMPPLTKKKINRLRNYFSIEEEKIAEPAAKKIFPDSDLTLNDLAFTAKALVSHDVFWYTLLTVPQRERFIDAIFKDELFCEKLLKLVKKTTETLEDPVETSTETDPVETPEPVETQTREDPVFPQLIGRLRTGSDPETSD